MSTNIFCTFEDLKAFLIQTDRITEETTDEDIKNEFDNYILPSIDMYYLLENTYEDNGFDEFLADKFGENWVNNWNNNAIRILETDFTDHKAIKYCIMVYDYLVEKYTMPEDEEKQIIDVFFSKKSGFIANFFTFSIEKYREGSKTGKIRLNMYNDSFSAYTCLDAITLLE